MRLLILSALLCVSTSGHAADSSKKPHAAYIKRQELQRVHRQGATANMSNKQLLASLRNNITAPAIYKRANSEHPDFALITAEVYHRNLLCELSDYEYEHLIRKFLHGKSYLRIVKSYNLKLLSQVLEDAVRREHCCDIVSNLRGTNIRNNFIHKLFSSCNSISAKTYPILWDIVQHYATPDMLQEQQPNTHNSAATLILSKVRNQKYITKIAHTILRKGGTIECDYNRMTSQQKRNFLKNLESLRDTTPQKSAYYTHIENIYNRVQQDASQKRAISHVAQDNNKRKCIKQDKAASSSSSDLSTSQQCNVNVHEINDRQRPQLPSIRSLDIGKYLPITHNDTR